jgi:hypothetical protein
MFIFLNARRFFVRKLQLLTLKCALKIADFYNKENNSCPGDISIYHFYVQKIPPSRGISLTL